MSKQKRVVYGEMMRDLGEVMNQPESDELPHDVSSAEDDPESDEERRCLVQMKTQVDQILWHLWCSTLVKPCGLLPSHPLLKKIVNLPLKRYFNCDSKYVLSK